jgi:membrane-associated protease RseP (regulator of RpoE activity)
MVVETNRIYTTVIVIAVVGLLFSCIFGAVAGGVAGLFLGQRQGRLAAERAMSENVITVPRIEQAPFPFATPRQTPSSVTGALIVEVVSGTPAEQAGLQAGDVITSIDNTPVNAVHQLPDVIAQYQPGDRVTIHLTRGNQQLSVTVRLGTNPDNPGQAYLGIYYEMQ